jgi:hypothetical protein
MMAQKNATSTWREKTPDFAPNRLARNLRSRRVPALSPHRLAIKTPTPSALGWHLRMGRSQAGSPAKSTRCMALSGAVRAKRHFRRFFSRQNQRSLLIFPNGTPAIPRDLGKKSGIRPLANRPTAPVFRRVATQVDNLHRYDNETALGGLAAGGMSQGPEQSHCGRGGDGRVHGGGAWAPKWPQQGGGKMCKTLRRLATLLGMLGTDHAGERENARAKIMEILCEHSCHWNDLLDLLRATAGRMPVMRHRSRQGPSRSSALQRLLASIFTSRSMSTWPSRSGSPTHSSSSGSW